MQKSMSVAAAFGFVLATASPALADCIGGVRIEVAQTKPPVVSQTTKPTLPLLPPKPAE
jgi:hypothetical protein